MDGENACNSVEFRYKVLLCRVVEIGLHGEYDSHVDDQQREYDNAEVVEYPAPCDTSFSHY